MPEINQLAAVDSVSAADLVPIYSSSNGDARKAAMSVLLTYFQNSLTASGGFLTQYSAPSTTGFSVTIAPLENGQPVHLLLTPVAGYASGTIVLPALATCIDGQEVLVNCTQSVTTLTVSGNGATVTGAPTALAANAFFRLKFDGVFDAWYRVG